MSVRRCGVVRVGVTSTRSEQKPMAGRIVCRRRRRHRYRNIRISRWFLPRFRVGETAFLIPRTTEFRHDFHVRSGERCCRCITNAHTHYYIPCMVYRVIHCVPWIVVHDNTYFPGTISCFWNRSSFILWSTLQRAVPTFVLRNIIFQFIVLGDSTYIVIFFNIFFNFFSDKLNFNAINIKTF